MIFSDISKYFNRFFIINSTVISAYSFIGRFADNHIKNYNKDNEKDDDTIHRVSI